MGTAFSSGAAGASSSSSSAPPSQADAPVMNDEAIRAVMNAEGPIVQMVLLHADGTVEEVTVDCTPRARNIEKFMESDSMTIVGGYQDLDLTVVNGTSLALPVSTAKLPFPLHEHTLRGTTVIMRNGEDGAQLDFTAEEFRALVDRPVSEDEQRSFEAEKAAIRMNEAQRLTEEAAAGEDSDEDDSAASGEEYTAENAEEDDESSDEEESSEEEGEGEGEEEGEEDEEMAQKTTVLYQVLETLAVKLKRAPTMDEIKQELREINAAQEGTEEDDEEDDEEDENEEAAASTVSETPAKENSLAAAAMAAAAALNSPDTVALDTPSALGKRKGEDKEEAPKEMAAVAEATEAPPSPKVARTEEVA